MLVSTMKYTRRFNVAQYEHEEITVDVVPDDGQSAEALLAETRAFVEGSRPKINGAHIAANGKPAPPLATPPKPAAGSMVPVLEQSIAAVKAEPPFTPNETPAPAPTKRKGRPPKAETEARKALESWRASANVDEFLFRFNELRSHMKVIPIDALDRILYPECRELYAKLNGQSPGSEKTTADITKAIKEERNWLESQKVASGSVI